LETNPELTQTMETRSSTEDSNVKYAWAEYLDCMEGASDDVVSLTRTKPKDSVAGGIIVCLLLTAAAMGINVLPFWPFTMEGSRHPFEPVMFSIVLGMILSNLWSLPKSFSPGVKFSVKKLLPLGIILLGARLEFTEILKLGFVGIAMSCFEIVLALALMLLFVKWLRLSGKLGTLLGIGTAICGGTAIVAAAPVIEAEESDVVFGVATVTLLGLIAMFLLPVLGHMLMLSEKAFGIWAGLAIHQTPQVVAAGFAYGQHAGETATVVKMSRVCLLAPVVFVTGLIYARKKAQKQEGIERKHINYFSLFPKFIFGFLALALLRTLGWLPDITAAFSPNAMGLGELKRSFNTAEIAKAGANFFIVMSMAGVGLETKLSAMRQTGLRPFFAAAVSSLVIAVVVLGLIKLLGIS
jgi:uncharacterized integral membrane protein (TIGR00698 family)